LLPGDQGLKRFNSMIDRFLQKLVAVALSLLSLSLGTVYGQDVGSCGTEITKAQEANLNKTLTARQNYNKTVGKRLTQVPVRFYVLRKSDGSDGIDTALLRKELDTINHYYKNAGIEFFLCEEIKMIDNDKYSPFYRYDEGQIAEEHYKPGVLNIYFVADLYINSDRQVCGYAKFPPSDDRIFMKNGCSTNGSTLAHEIGHYFSLYHTHRGYNSPNQELVNGSNCEIRGDQICGTPADPKLSGKKVNNCQYTQNEKDLNGDVYQPQVGNIMSYAPRKCRDTLTPEQYNWISYSLENDRNYLDCCAEPRADFGYKNFNYSQEMKFYDSSMLGKDKTWYFGNGDSSKLTSPNYEYKDTGFYKVKMVVENQCATDTAVQEFYVAESGVYPAGRRESTPEKTKTTIYPNPFTNSLNLSFSLKQPKRVQVEVYNLRGQAIAKTEGKLYEADNHHIELFNQQSLNNNITMLIVKMMVGDELIQQKVMRR